MKRILAITLTLVMLLAVLTGCMASRKPSGDEGEQAILTMRSSTLPYIWCSTSSQRCWRKTMTKQHSPSW